MDKVVSAKINDISPMIVLKVSMTVKGEEDDSQIENIIFLDQASGQIYDNEGPVEENFNKAVLEWIQKKNEEVKRHMEGTIAKATPEQLRQMGIDIARGPNPSSKIII
jgi:hypothetical protein